MDTNSFDKLINRIIDKRYKIENVVGVGGMAYVLKARDLVAEQDVAIKILSDEFKDDERAVKRFINESKTVSMLSHKNIVKILDVVISEERKYIVMEFIDGITLKDYMDRIGTLSWKEAVYYTKQVLDALSHAHEKQVIHRDVKPQNIMLLPDGTVKVTDFGIAKIPNAESITMTDKAIGTVNYISPEQASGGKVDFRTDIYSTGVMLYEMVTGRLPFIADSPVAVAMMQVSNEPLAPREINQQIPVGLEQIILKAMRKDPDDRFVSASAMLKALDYFAHNPNVVFANTPSGTGASGAKINKGDYENEEKKKARLKKYVRGSRSMFPIVSGVAASFLAVALIFLLVWVIPLFKGTSSTDENASTIDKLGNGFSMAVDKVLGVDGNNSEERKVTVISFTGRKYDGELTEYMQSEGYAISAVNYVRSTSYGSNVVVRQDPEEGAVRVKQEGKLIPVTLYVNMGSEEARMPDCELMHQSDAKKIIRTELSAAMTSEFPLSSIKVVEEYHDSYPAEYVIRTEPAADELVKVSDDLEVTLYVSKGQKISSTLVPTLEGLTLDEARRAIINSKLALGKIYYEESDTVGAGVVIKASHSAGELAAQGITAVDLWVSIGSSDPDAVIRNTGIDILSYDTQGSISTRPQNNTPATTTQPSSSSDKAQSGAPAAAQAPVQTTSPESSGSSQSDSGNGQIDDIAGLIAMRDGN